MIPINGVIINVPYTTFLGIRYDERYRAETCVYLLERNGKKVLYEYHSGNPQITKDDKVTEHDIKEIRKEIEDYDEECEECEDPACSCHLNIEKQKALKEITPEISMFV